MSAASGGKFEIARPSALMCSDPGPVTEYGGVPCESCPECLSYQTLVDMHALKSYAESPLANIDSPTEFLAAVEGLREAARRADELLSLPEHCWGEEDYAERGDLTEALARLDRARGERG